MKQKVFNYLINKTYVFYLLGYLFLNHYSFKKIKRKKISMGWGIAICTSEVFFPINKISANLKKNNELINTDIQDTPHFKLLKNDNYIKDYLDYIKTNFPKEDPDKKLQDFLNLKNLVITNPDNFYILIKKELSMFKNKRSKIIDGLHRASLLKSIDKSHVRCLIIDRIID